MRNSVIVGFLLALATGAAGQAQQGGRGGAAIPVDRSTIKGAPYSAEFVSESVQTLADGNRIVHRRTGRIYRDKEGRVRREEDRAAGGPSVSVTDPVARTSFTLDPETRTARRTPAVLLFDLKLAKVDFEKVEAVFQDLKRAQVLIDGQTPGRARGAGAAPAAGATGGGRGGGAGGRGRGAGASANAVEEKLADRTIEGVLATGVRRTTTIEKGAIGNEQPILSVSETWTSPELQVQVLTDFSDPRTGRSTYRLWKIHRADPDPALFQIPAGYTIMKVPPPVWIDK